MTVDPKVSAIVNILIALVGVVGALGAEWTTLFGAGTAQQIVLIGSYAATILGSVNTILHGVSAPTAGPLVKGPSNGTP